jgi:signal transduction histidine kinase
MLSLENDAAISSLFNIAVRSVERIQRLTNSLLDINRLEAGQPVINDQLAQPQTLIREAADAVSPIAQTKKQSLTIHVPEDLQPVMVDAEMIRRVIINLIENAVKFSPPEGAITVNAVQEGEFIRICVDDTGPGIPEVSRDKIFNKFARLQDGRGPKGLGLGLAYCRLAVEGHKGNIWVVDAPGENGGASFNFTIPIADLSSGK